jgi:hypothetical protein
MIHNYNANLDTRENRDLLNRIFQIQLVKDKFYVPNDIQPNIFRHDLLFGQVREGEGSSVNNRQFSLPVGGLMSAGGAMTGGALVSNGRLASHEAIYLEDENQRRNPLQQTPFLGKRGVSKMSGGLVFRKEPIQMTQPIPRKGAGIKAFGKRFGNAMKVEGDMAKGMVGAGGSRRSHIMPDGTIMSGATHTSKSKVLGKKGGSVAIKSAIKQKVSEKIKALPMKKLTGQFSILNKVI